MTISNSKIGSNTPKKYRFIFNGINGELTLKNAPLEWNSSSIALTRNIDSAGIDVEYIVESLTFVKDGYRYLKNLFDQKGLFSECDLYVFYFDYITREYIQFPTSFRLDFNTYSNIKVGKSANAVKINALPTSLLAKLKTREKIKVDVTRTTSIGGYEIPIQDHWTNLKKELNFPEINSYRVASLGKSSSTGEFDVTDGDTFLIPLTVISSDFNESQNVVFGKNQTLDNSNAFYGDSIEDRDVLIALDFTIDVNVAAVGILSTDIYIRVLDTDGTSTVSTTYIDGVPNIVGSYDISYSDTISVLTGQSIIIFGESAGIGTSTLEITETTMSNSQAVVTSPAKTVESLPIYEAIERTLQLILDTQYPLYSTKFGRTDVVYNSDGDMYPTESQFSFVNVVNGLLLRSLNLDNSENQVAITLQDLLKSINCIYNIGWGFDVVGGEDRIIIEDRDYFYIDSVGLDLSDRLQDLDIESEVFPDLAFAQVKSGFKTFDYEEINGRGEYNTTNERTTKIPNDNVYDIVSTYRADTKGITKQLSSPAIPDGINTLSASEDVKGDKDIFFIKSQRNGDEWDAETDENVQIENNTSLFQEGSLNTYFTPTRNLLRHDYIIRAGLEGELNSYLRFQTVDKLANLQTTDGVTSITESQDILIDDLTESIYEAVVLIFSVPFFEDDYTTLVANKYNLIQVTDNLSGWLIDFKYKLGENKAEFKILKKYVSS